MVKLILMRHGQSHWNYHNLFTGWVDVPLSTTGIEESLDAGRYICNEPIDVIFTSTLVRALMTAMIAMTCHSSGKVPIIQHTGEGRLEEWGKIHSHSATNTLIPVIRAWELNERMYGDLQGVNKQELAERYGPEQVKIWRRSFDIPPPGGESLKMTAERTIPYFDRFILPYLTQGKSVLIAAHGNSLRALLMKLESIDPQQVVNVELKTGHPLIYQYKSGQFFKQF